MLAQAAGLACAAALLAGLVDVLLLAAAGAGAAPLPAALLLSLAAAPLALLLGPLPGLLRAGSRAARRHPGAVLGAVLGGLAGLRAAEAVDARLFATLHRADLAGLILATTTVALAGSAALAGGLLGRRLLASPPPADLPPRARHRPIAAAAPLIPLIFLGIWACWRVAALDLAPHLPGGPLLLAAAWAALVTGEAVRQPVARLAGPRALTALGLLALLTVGGLLGSALFFPAAPGAQRLLEERAFLPGLLLPGLRRALDRDADGFSPAWGGGDCDDTDPAVHPGAPDRPGDGIDQDCLGGDAATGVEANPADPLGLGSLPRRAPLPAGQPPFRSVILLVIDALRFDATAAGAASPSATPALDAFAAGAAWFSGARAVAPGTWPALPALLTGRYPRALRWADHGSPPGLAPDNVTLPEELAAAGIHTQAIVSGYLRWRLPGLGQGFAGFHSVLPQDATREQRDDTSPLFVAQALELLAEHGLDRLFLYVHFIDPHAPYTEHPGFTHGGTPRELYRGELAYTDHHLGLLLRDIAALPGADDAAIILTADHGEEFGEHGRAYHAGQLYEESIHVPLIIAGRGIAPGQRSAPVSGVDLATTILDLLGIPETEGPLRQGRSLVPDLFGEPPPGALERPLFAELGPWEQGGQTALLERGRLKLLHRPGKAAAYELYDLLEDPHERRNLIRDRPGEAARLIARLSLFESGIAAEGPGSPGSAGDPTTVGPGTSVGTGTGTE